MNQLNSNKKELLISGFIRKYISDYKIKHLFYSFTFKLSEQLKFSSKYKSQDGLKLLSNGFRVIKSSDTYSWILVDILPVFTGIHCWRIFINNPDCEFIQLGVSNKRIFLNNFDEESVWGIARIDSQNTDSFLPKSNRYFNKINLQHFINEKCEIDMLLDADVGVLKLCVLDTRHPTTDQSINIKNEAVLWGMPCGNQCRGWVPQFRFGWESFKTSMIIYNIDCNYYGKQRILTPLNMFSLIDNSLTFHLIGINDCKPKLLPIDYDDDDDDWKLFGDINMNCINYNTYFTSLKLDDTIGKLKDFILHIYNLSIKFRDKLLILYANNVISYDNKTRLRDYGITNNSVFFIVINCDNNNNPIDTIITSTTSLLPSTYIDNIYATKGFDVITQESNVSLYEMPNCNHLMNIESLFRYSLMKYSDSINIDLKCPHENMEYKINIDSPSWSCTYCTYLNNINDIRCEMCDNRKIIVPKSKYCDAIWNYSFIKPILMKSINIHDIHDNLPKLELLASRNKLQNEFDIQKCPKCFTIYYKNKNKDNNGDDNDDIKTLNDVMDKFKTECIICTFCWADAFCWACGKEWNIDHFCDLTFARDLHKILLKTDTKKIGYVSDVPLIRACPNCCQLITHIEACKHIKCSSCKTSFCFVCLKLYKINGGWQCGSSGSKCDVAPRQNIEILTKNIIIKKKAFKLF